MMYKHTTNGKRKWLAASCSSLFLIIALFFSGNTQAQNSEISKQDLKFNQEYFKNAVFRISNEKGQDIFSDYDNLSDKRKEMLPPPPPIPSGEELKPLPKGTLVVLTDDGKVIIQSSDDVKVPPPPPPPPPVPDTPLRKRG